MSNREYALTRIALLFCLCVTPHARAQEDLLVANSRAIEADLAPRVARVEVVSLGTVSSSRQSANGLQVRLSQDCSAFELKSRTQLPDRTWFWLVAERPATIVAHENYIVIEGGRIVGDFVNETRDGLEPTVRRRYLQTTRARAFLRFTVPRDAADVAVTLDRWSKACGAPASIATTHSIALIGADVNVTIEINGTKAGRIAAGKSRSFQLPADRAVRLVARTESEDVVDERLVQVPGGQAAAVLFKLSDSVETARRERLEWQRQEARESARRRFEAAISGRTSTNLSGPQTVERRSDRLRSTLAALESHGLATEADRARYTQALREQKVVTVDILSVDDRAIGRMVTPGTVDLVSIGATRYAERFDLGERVNARELELPIGTHPFVVTFDMEFEGQDFRDVPCRGTVVIGLGAMRLGINLTLVRGGRLECSMRSY